MKYEDLGPLSRDFLVEELNTSDPSRVATALIRLALHDSDREFVESTIVRFLKDDDPWTRGIAALAAAHVARIHRALTKEEIVPLIRALLVDSRTNGKAQDALEDIELFLGRPV